MDNEKMNIIPDPDSGEDFETIYNKYSLLVLNVAYQYLKDEHLAEEVMQEVMFRYYQHQHDEALVYKKAWMITIAKNLCINILKKRQYEICSDEIEVISGYCDKTKMEELNAENIYLQSERQEILEGICDDMLNSIKRKNLKEYRALHEVYYNGKREKAVAIEMGMTEGSFYTMLCRTKAKIRDRYKERYTKAGEL